MSQSYLVRFYEDDGEGNFGADRYIGPFQHYEPAQEVAQWLMADGAGIEADVQLLEDPELFVSEIK